MRVGPSRLALIDVARQSGQEAVLPHSECSRDVEHCLTKRGSRCLTGPPAELHFLFCFMFRYRTAFAKKTESVELLTLEYEADGVWRVIGYEIR